MAPQVASAPTISGKHCDAAFRHSAVSTEPLWAILGTTYIMQASVANQIAQNPTMQITRILLGPGPFQLDSYSSSLIKFEAQSPLLGWHTTGVRGRGTVRRHQCGGQRCAGE